MADVKSCFEADGFVVVANLFTEPEVAQMKAEIRRILEDARAQAVAAGHSASDVARDGVFVGLAASSPFFRRLAQDARLLDPLEAILGPDLEFLSDKVVFKSAGVDYGSPWHQDWPYWEGAHKISIWVALDAATPENGCLKMLPGSHKHVATHDGTPLPGEGFGHRLRSDAVDESRAAILPAVPGDAIYFHDLTLHASFPNTTGQDRWAFITTYRSAAEPDLDYGWAVARQIVRSAGQARSDSGS
ncbi:MAG TPA: phytanoyl-CoA dioxygenase family protein [Chthonomonadaceae bacterium]|nr:phytanoyl-CoA dioxygenase family protein [Chthonomonadaceae bacterium]